MEINTFKPWYCVNYLDLVLRERLQLDLNLCIYCWLLTTIEDLHQLLKQLKENTSVHFKKWYQWNMGSSFTGNWQILAPRQHFGRKQRGGLRKECMCSWNSAYLELEVLAILQPFASPLCFCFCFVFLFSIPHHNILLIICSYLK